MPITVSPRIWSVVSSWSSRSTVSRTLPSIEFSMAQTAASASPRSTAAAAAPTLGSGSSSASGSQASAAASV